MLAPVKKDMRGCNKELADAVKALDEAVARHLTKAERENATVYLQVRSWGVLLGDAQDLPAMRIRQPAFGARHAYQLEVSFESPCTTVDEQLAAPAPSPKMSYVQQGQPEQARKLVLRTHCGVVAQHLTLASWMRSACRRQRTCRQSCRRCW